MEEVLDLSFDRLRIMMMLQKLFSLPSGDYLNVETCRGYMNGFIQCTRLLMFVVRWRIWLRHCVTSRKVAVSIPDGVTRILH